MTSAASNCCGQLASTARHRLLALICLCIVQLSRQEPGPPSVTRVSLDRTADKVNQHGPPLQGHYATDTTDQTSDQRSTDVILTSAGHGVQILVNRFVYVRCWTILSYQFPSMHSSHSFDEIGVRY
ncbi:hypothetical protein RRG08_034525 [Elysia crispata]|uniref:Uncharacterized protein n=1 Tax=Elysia crispata TaxID=231223 RepID=A0AAE1ED75_9GAST|nr:hypothetical protein RRG08_034525 [Elysia crispata]